MANTPTAHPTPIPALAPAERRDLEPEVLIVGKLLAGEIVADECVADEFNADGIVAVAEGLKNDSGVSVDNAEERVDENADAGRELILTSRGATPSQRNAKELKATRPKHSPYGKLLD